jgi:hypothetical protein
MLRHWPFWLAGAILMMAGIGVYAASSEKFGVPGAEAYASWLHDHPEQGGRVTRFEALLRREGVQDVLPTWQVLRTDREWLLCRHTAFDLAPEADWPHMVKTLKFIRDEVVPAVGPVEVVSGYREAKFNACVGGAAKSAHRDFWALDLIPLDKAITRKDLIGRICKAHIASGRAYNTGLGFYSGLRFHIDSKSYRRWGADHKGASSPCA